MLFNIYTFFIRHSHIKSFLETLSGSIVQPPSFTLRLTQDVRIWRLISLSKWLLSVLLLLFNAKRKVDEPASWRLTTVVWSQTSHGTAPVHGRMDGSSQISQRIQTYGRMLRLNTGQIETPHGDSFVTSTPTPGGSGTDPTMEILLQFTAERTSNIMYYRISFLMDREKHWISFQHW